jgi:hypothetical protein
MTVSEIIELLGGRTAVSAFTGWPYTTIESWEGKGQIPDWRKGKLLEMALANGKSLSATDFPPNKPRERAAA